MPKVAEPETDKSQSTPTFTARQKAFIKAYSRCRNGAEAARQAGYSVHSAHVIASRLLSNVNIAEACERGSDWDFEAWCNSVKSIFHNENAWQAQLRSLELYGKAKGWLRDQASLELNVSIVERISKVIHLQSAHYNSNSLPNNNLQLSAAPSQAIIMPDKKSLAQAPDRAPAGGSI